MALDDWVRGLEARVKTHEEWLLALEKRIEELEASHAAPPPATDPAPEGGG